MREKKKEKNFFLFFTHTPVKLHPLKFVRKTIDKI